MKIPMIIFIFALAVLLHHCDGDPAEIVQNPPPVHRPAILMPDIDSGRTISICSGGGRKIFHLPEGQLYQIKSRPNDTLMVHLPAGVWIDDESLKVIFISPLPIYDENDDSIKWKILEYYKKGDIK